MLGRGCAGFVLHAQPKAHQEDHYEPVGSMDASTVLYRRL